MKKLIAIVLISVQVFSICGHLMLREYMVYQSNKFYNEQTGKGRYNVHDLTEIVLPVHLKGIKDWDHYENVSGQIQFEHNSYNYVKMKLTRTAMYLMCVPNYSSTRLAAHNIIAVKGIKNMPVPKKDHVPIGKCVFLSNFNYTLTRFAFSNPVEEIKTESQPITQRLASHMPDIPEQPPKAGC